MVEIALLSLCTAGGSRDNLEGCEAVEETSVLAQKHQVSRRGREGNGSRDHPSVFPLVPRILLAAHLLHVMRKCSALVN